MAGYDPEIINYERRYTIGEISENAKKIESIGDTCHDFIKQRSKPSVVLARIEYLSRNNLAAFNKSEEDVSMDLHAEFNGNSDPLKADLRLLEKYKVYETAEGLTADLFIGEDVKPLIFMLSQDKLAKPEFQGIFNKLKEIMKSKYKLEPCGSNGDLGVTHDAYKHPIRGNPFEANIMFSAATLCDPGIAGSSDDDIKAAMRDNRFILDGNLSGSSFWGSWTLETSIDRTYDGAKIKLIIDDQEIKINVPKEIRSGLSVLDLSIIYDKIINGLTGAQIDGLVSELVSKHKGNIGAMTNLFKQVVTNALSLYRNPDLSLKFIFLLKEYGDMVQHKMAIYKKHLAGGSVDRLSTIAFLKRGTPISYMPKVDKRGLPYILFRVSGTLHKEGDEADGWQARLEALKAQQLTKLQREEEEKAARKARKDERSRAIAAEKIADEEEARQRTLAALSGRASRAQRGRGYPKSTRKNRKRARRRTFKQQGGAFDVSIKRVIIKYYVMLLINAIFSNLYTVLLDRTLETSLFNNITLDEGENFIDLSLIGKFTPHLEGTEVFLDNPLLGLPLTGIMYVLYDNLDELSEKEYDYDNLVRDLNIITHDFLIAYNYKAREIEFIEKYIRDNIRNVEGIKGSNDIISALIAPLRRAAGDAPRGLEGADEFLVSRSLTIEDKEILRNFVNKGSNIPGIALSPSIQSPLEYETLDTLIPTSKNTRTQKQKPINRAHSLYENRISRLKAKAEKNRSKILLSSIIKNAFEK
jgi:hypothetical protein